MSKPKLQLIRGGAAAQAAATEELADLAPSQQEMPFAVVHGEPVTQMPRDLYIPPHAR